MMNSILINGLREFMGMKVRFKKAVLSQLDPYLRGVFEGETFADLPNIQTNPKNLMSSFQMIGIL